MPRAVLIGDSHSTVTNNFLKEKLEQDGYMVPLTLQNVGWSIHSYLSRDVLNQVREARPDTVVVKLGGNNYIQNEQKYKEKMDLFLQEIGYPKTKVVWIGPYYSDESRAPETAAKHDWTRAWMKSNLPKDIAFIDSYDYSKTGHSNDGVHFTRSSYRRMIDEMYPQILAGMKKGINPLLLVFGLSLASVAVILGWSARRKNDTARRIGKV